VPTYTKKIARSDKILIDDVDVSNSFSEFGYTSDREVVPVTGFSSSGVVETLPGSTTQGFSGTAFYTEELALIVEPLHRNGTLATISWQPDGLADPTREIFYGECYINTFGPANTVGGVSTMPFAATAGDATGIRVTDWT
jgi:hypothetical protein